MKYVRLQKPISKENYDDNNGDDGEDVGFVMIK